MVNIDKLIPIVVLLCLLSVFAVGAPSRLIITDLDVSVDEETDKNLKDGDTIRYEASPESRIEFKIEVKNNYTSSEGIEIEDISVKVYIREIDDEDDLEESSEEFDLNANKDKKVAIDFSLPLRVEVGEYSIDIEAEGEDKNGTTHAVSQRLYLNLEKENHLLRLEKADLEKNSLQCLESTYLGIEILNIGEKEEDVELYIKNSKLGINEKRDFTLSEEPYDTDSSYSERVSLNIPKNIEKGNYPLELSVLYSGRVIEKNILLNVTCNKQQEQPEKTKEEVKEVDVKEADEIITTTIKPDIVIQEPLIERYKYTIIVVLAYIIVFIALIVFVVKIFRKKGV